VKLRGRLFPRPRCNLSLPESSVVFLKGNPSNYFVRVIYLGGFVSRKTVPAPPRTLSGTR